MSLPGVGRRHGECHRPVRYPNDVSCNQPAPYQPTQRRWLKVTLPPPITRQAVGQWLLAGVELIDTHRKLGGGGFFSAAHGR